MKHHGFTPMVSLGASAESAETLPCDDTVAGYPPLDNAVHPRLYSRGFLAQAAKK